MKLTLRLSILAIFSAFFMTTTAAGQTDAQADAAAVAATAGLPSAAGAPKPGWRNQFGAGYIANPKFVGSDEYNTRVIPYIELRYFDESGTRFFANVPQGIGGYAYRKRERASGRFFNVGASLAPGFNVRDDSIDGLDEIGISTEARLLLETGGRRWAASAVFAQDVGSGHEGAYVDLNLSWRGRVGAGSGFYAVGPVLRFGDSTYKDAFFGVSPEDSIETGLPAYDADAGVERVGVQGLVSLPIKKSRWRFTAILRGSQLIDNAAASPIVVDETQFFFLSAVTRSF
ncbi:MipA/OmpV family protein [Congregibacter variabilis]|uniref:MipA/OmpV family protein n=1 Tax=Congregibacter variabilis TaxID=3081200 RepID=A0ABZ0I6P5_9GAMM|nr:MipA/OmpV family protein [Congregibacter sp. IMCC43200]